MALALNKIEASKGFESREALESGTYDAVLSAIIDLELQKNDYDKDNIKIEHHVKLLFEIPEYTQEVDGVELPILLSREVNLTSGKKGNFYKAVSALMKSPSLSEDELLDIINTDGAVKELLGKALVLQIEQYETQYKNDKNEPIKRNKITGFSPLRASKKQPDPVREPFVFEVADPDLEVFRDKLSKWTRDKIMTAENNDEFPPALHKTYRDIKEQEQQSNKKEDE